MNVNRFDISNLKDIYLYIKNLKDNSEFPSIIGQSSIYNTAKITLSIEDLDAFVLLELKALSSKLKITSVNVLDSSNISENYDIPQTTIDDINDYDNFFNYIKEDDNIDSGIFYNLILKVHYNALAIFDGSCIISLIGSRIEEVFMNENGLMSEQEFDESIDSIKDKLLKYIINGIYSGLNNSLNSENKVVTKELERMFYSKAEFQSVILCRAITPYGGDIKFMCSNDEDDGLQTGIEAINECKQNDILDDIDIYFVCSSTFYSFFKLSLFDNIDVNCYNIKDQLELPNIYINEFILNKYQKRLNSFLIPLLNWKQFIYSSEEYLNFYKVLFSTYNNIIKYFIKVKRSDLDVLKTNIDNIISDETTTEEIENSDYKTILKSFSEVISSVLKTIK